MNLNVWHEDCSNLVKNWQIQAARRRHCLHQPPPTLDAWQRRRTVLIKEIRRNAGTFPAPPPLKMKMHGVIRLPGYEIRKITYQSRPGLRVTANLYVPDGPGPFPGIIGVHGHWPQGKITERVQARGHILALNGFVVLSIDAFGAGERGTVPGQFEYHGAGIGATLFDIGESLLGMQVYDNRRGIDLLESLDFVDAGHIGVTGASGGGVQTMWLAALDPRIKAAVPVVSVGTFESYVTRRNCVCEVLPNGLTFLEEWAVLGLIAPNALLILNALQDGTTFCVPEMIRSFNDARRIYQLYGMGDKIAYQAFDLPHGYWPVMQQHMLGWFKRWLKQEGEGRPCALPVYKPLPEAQCLCFPDSKRPASVASIPEYCRPIARRLAAGHHQLGQPAGRAGKLRQLRNLLRLPAPEPGNSITDIGGLLQEPYHIRKLMLESEPGILLPVTLLTSPGIGIPHAATIVLHPNGKQVFEKAGWLKDRTERGQAMILTDLRGTGETCYDKEPLNNQTFHDHSRACFWLGRTLLGDWTADITALVQYAAARPRRTPIDIIAYAETGLAALCAAALTRRIRSIITINMPGSYLFQGFVMGRSMALHVPGILRWGDISMMAALADCRVDILNPINSEGRTYSTTQCRALQKEIARLAGRFKIKSRVRARRGVTPLVCG